MASDVLIIGAGHNGLVTAYYLGRAGLGVELVEAREIIGGACTTQELIPGYQFSTCANVCGWLRPKVVEDLRLLERGLHAEPGPGRLLLPDRRSFSGALEEIAQLSPADAAAHKEWVALWRKMAQLLGPYLLSYPPTLRVLFERACRLGVEDALSTVLTTSVYELADRFFESELLRNFVRPGHDIGSGYDRGSGLARALAAAMSGYSETGERRLRGAFVNGGMGRVTELMAEAAREQGAVIRTNSPVQRILVEDGRATGVELASGERLAARVVISNADPKRTFLRLVHPEDLPTTFRERVRHLRTDVAALKFHCALSEAPEYYALPDADLRTRARVTICPDRAYFERAWDDARHGRLPEAPSMTLMTPTILDPSLAPPGHHTVSFWILYAPVHLQEGNWPERRAEMAERLLRQVDQYSPNFRRALVDQVLLTPWDLEQQELLTDGNIHHVDISPSQMLWQRPLPELARYRAPLQGLYLCGAGQHPYGEVTGAPGHNAAHAVLEDREVIAPGSWEEWHRAGES